MNHIRDLAAQGLSIRRIADETGIARNTVRKYIRGRPEPAPRLQRASKLDPFKDQILRWMEEDHLFNCQTMLERLREMGYVGSGTILRVFVQPLRPARRGRTPIIRYETAPGEQVQIDWGEFTYEEEGKLRKVYGLTAVLSYSRARYVCFFKRCDAPSLIRGLMAAFEYFGGVPRVLLTDRMKSVLVSVEDSRPVWNARFADFAAALGIAPRVCRAYTPQTKGKVERSISLIKTSFWAGVRFTDLADLNEQARRWCEGRNHRVHQTTHARPVDRLPEEKLLSLPQGYAWERYRCEERRVSWDGYVSYDGVLYGVPASASLTGKLILVGSAHAQVRLWSQGTLVAEHRLETRSGHAILHPEQFTGVPTAHELKRQPLPLGHRADAPPLVRRTPSDYDNLFGLQTAMSRSDERVRAAGERIGPHSRQEVAA